MRSAFLTLVVFLSLAITGCGTSPGGDGEARGSIVAPDENANGGGALDTQVQTGGLYCTASAVQSNVASGQTITIKVDTSNFNGSYRIVNSSINGRTEPTVYVTTSFANTSGATVTRKIGVRVVDEAAATYVCSTSVSITSS